MHTEVAALHPVPYLKFLKQLSTQDLLEMENVGILLPAWVEQCSQSKFINGGLRSSEVK